MLGTDAAGGDRIIGIEQLIAALQREVDEVEERIRLDPNVPLPEPAYERRS